MGRKGKEICGHFTVETEDNQFKQLLVIQDFVSYYSKEESYSKTFRLESLDGVVVYKTENPAIFRLANGTLLKRKIIKFSPRFIHLNCDRGQTVKWYRNAPFQRDLYTVS